jgi:AcrR family transcriptional regulator
MRSSLRPQDRARRTRERLIRAFNELFLSRGFEQVSAQEIALHAGVGRSTLYTHFNGPLEVLEASLEGICRILAAAVRADSPSSRLVPLLEHLRSQWHRNRGFFEEPIRSVMSRCLARAISAALLTDPGRTRHRPALSREWLAPVLADLQLAIIRRWLTGQQASAAALAATLTASTQRLVSG